ncbi:MAG: hypothetical protein ACM3H8_03240 [Sphingobacteriales bacterium]
MKKIVAAILLFVFISVQYGRVSSYYHCIILNAVKTDFKPDCDCQKILLVSPSSEQNNATIPIHTHSISLDEFFVWNEQPVKFNCNIYLAGYNGYYDNQYHFTCSNNYFIPPEC